MASEEFLVRFRYWLVSGGMMMRSACGTDKSRHARRMQPQRVSCLGLSLWNAANAAANDLGDERGGIEGQSEKQRHEFGTDDGAAREVEFSGNRNVEGERKAGDDEDQQWQADDQCDRRPYGVERLAGCGLAFVGPARDDDGGDNRNHQGDADRYHTCLEDRLREGQSSVVEEHAERQTHRLARLRQNGENAEIPEKMTSSGGMLRKTST